MKVEREVVLPAVPEIKTTEEEYILCDICKTSKGKSGMFYAGEVDWWENQIFPTSIVVTLRGNLLVESYHICPSCWRDAFKPLLKRSKRLRLEPHVEKRD